MSFKKSLRDPHVSETVVVPSRDMLLPAPIQTAACRKVGWPVPSCIFPAVPFLGRKFAPAWQVEMAAQYANNEMKRTGDRSDAAEILCCIPLTTGCSSLHVHQARLRSEHDQAITSLAENMNRRTARAGPRSPSNWYQRLAGGMTQCETSQRSSTTFRRHPGFGQECVCHVCRCLRTHEQWSIFVCYGRREGML